MVKFAHISDVHLGGWKQPQLQELNLKSFTKSIDICIQRKLDFVLIAGDLFDSAYPPIEILKETFAQLRRLKEANIPCFIIAGSHDYSVSGKTFLDVLEKSGFCKNVLDVEELEGKLVLNPTIFGGVALYGYPGKKSGLEIEDLRKIKLNDSPGMFKILMLHTTIDKAKGTLPIDAIVTEDLPEADYYALGHLHIDFRYKNFIYPGPIFPNNFQELEDLSYGSFYIVDSEDLENLEKIELKIIEPIAIDVEVTNALTSTEKIISRINQLEVKDKILLLRIWGNIETGKVSDVKFSKIEEHAKNKGTYAVLRNTHDLKVKEVEMEIEVKETGNIEEETVEVYSNQNPSDFNKLIPELMEALSIEKQEGEKTDTFTRRVLESSRRILGF